MRSRRDTIDLSGAERAAVPVPLVEIDTTTIRCNPILGVDCTSPTAAIAWTAGSWLRPPPTLAALYVDHLPRRTPRCCLPGIALRLDLQATLPDAAFGCPFSPSHLLLCFSPAVNMTGASTPSPPRGGSSRSSTPLRRSSWAPLLWASAQVKGRFFFALLRARPRTAAVTGTGARPQLAAGLLTRLGHHGRRGGSVQPARMWTDLFLMVD